jgi:hypothetical protein
MSCIYGINKKLDFIFGTRRERKGKKQTTKTHPKNKVSLALASRRRLILLCGISIENKFQSCMIQVWLNSLHKCFPLEGYEQF